MLNGFSLDAHFGFQKRWGDKSRLAWVYMKNELSI